ncbi:MAG TPA: hypothetical protein VMI54_28750 [Polyangiaceae bacterium]|nr:hypothetical protein [Polyangiaceae bacterium]
MATFAGTFWFVARAAADESAGRTDPTRVASATESPEHAPVEEDRLSDEAELARIVGLVDAAKYEECAARLSRLLDPQSAHPLAQPQIVETSRIYYATCLMGLGKDEQADEVLRAAIRKNPQMRPPDSLTFPARVVDHFLKVREQLYTELRATEQKAIERAKQEAAAKQKRDNEQWAHTLMLERLARQEVVVEKNSRYVALLPFGVGQFQNGNKTLGWTFLVAETMLGATALTSLSVFSTLNIQAARYEARGQQPSKNVNDRLTNWHLALTGTTYALLGVAALGMVEAEASFVPEVKRIRERPLPKIIDRVSVLPDVAVGPHDVTIGVSGAF